jgi:hypothetical protein
MEIFGSRTTTYLVKRGCIVALVFVTLCLKGTCIDLDEVVLT